MGHERMSTYMPDQIIYIRRERCACGSAKTKMEQNLHHLWLPILGTQIRHHITKERDTKFSGIILGSAVFNFNLHCWEKGGNKVRGEGGFQLSGLSAWPHFITTRSSDAPIDSTRGSIYGWVTIKDYWDLQLHSQVSTTWRFLARTFSCCPCWSEITNEPIIFGLSIPIEIWVYRTLRWVAIL